MEAQNKKTKVVMINLHGDTNMTSAYLHSLVKQSGYKIITINFRRMILDWKIPSEKELRTLKKIVQKLKPDVIGMSVNSMGFWDAVIITKIFKKDFKILWGGVQPLIDPESCLEHVDIICRGEGDESFIEFLDKIEKGKSIEKLKNFWIKKNNKIIKNDFRAIIQNLDTLPFPDFSDDNKLYILGEKIFKRNPLPLIKYKYNISFSRGCPFNCSYCINHFYNKKFDNKYLRKRSIKNVIKELKYAKKRFPKLSFINFWDDVFIADVKWVRNFVKEYKKHINMPFFAYGNSNLVNKENITLLRNAGLVYFDIGIQSGCQKIRNYVFKRTDTNENILKASKIIKSFKIPVAYDLIFSEFENEKTVKEGLNFLTKLPKPFTVNMNQLAYYPNFEITKKALKENKISIGKIASKNPNIRSQVISKEKIDDNNLICYFLLLGNRIIPNKFVLYLFKKRVHKKYSKLLNILSSKLNIFYGLQNVLKNMWGYLLNKEFKYILYRITNKKDLF